MSMLVPSSSNRLKAIPLCNMCCNSLKNLSMILCLCRATNKAEGQPHVQSQGKEWITIIKERGVNHKTLECHQALSSSNSTSTIAPHSSSNSNSTIRYPAVNSPLKVVLNRTLMPKQSKSRPGTVKSRTTQAGSKQLKQKKEQENET